MSDGQRFDMHEAINQQLRENFEVVSEIKDSQLYGMPFEASDVVSEDTMTAPIPMTIEIYMGSQDALYAELTAAQRDRAALNAINERLIDLEQAYPDLDTQSMAIRRARYNLSDLQ